MSLVYILDCYSRIYTKSASLLKSVISVSQIFVVLITLILSKHEKNPDVRMFLKAVTPGLVHHLNPESPFTKQFVAFSLCVFVEHKASHSICVDLKSTVLCRQSGTSCWRLYKGLLSPCCRHLQFMDAALPLTPLFTRQFVAHSPFLFIFVFCVPFFSCLSPESQRTLHFINLSFSNILHHFLSAYETKE